MVSTSTNIVNGTTPFDRANPAKDVYHYVPLWEGPSVIRSIRTGKTVPTQSILKASSKTPSAIQKDNRVGPVHLGPLGFEGDQQTYHEHGGPEKAVLQYNPNHYLLWREELKDVMMKDEKKRNILVNVGGFGENLATDDLPSGPPMDENTVCIGDVIGIRKAGMTKENHAKIIVTGPREPCYKLNHRFGVGNMAQRAQNSFRTGWLYSICKEGEVEIGDELILLERPHPDWPVARVQHFLYNDPRNYDMIKEILRTLQQKLVFDVRGNFERRLQKGVENMDLRLKDHGDPNAPREKFVKYRLSNRRKETSRISEFVFERIEKVDECSSDFTIAMPGSHVRLKFKLPSRDGIEIIRPYSIVNGDSNGFRLGIALSDKSRGGSSFLHQNLLVDDQLDVSEKFANTFPLMDEDVADHHVFLAGGIGITAFLDHIQHCVNNNKPFHLHYLVRNASDVAFISDIATMVSQPNLLDLSNRNGHGMTANDENGVHAGTASPFQISIYDSAGGNRSNVKDLLAKVTKNSRTHIYICGSERLSDAVIEHARELGIGEGRLHFEQFSVDASGDPFVAELTESKRSLHVAGEQTLLEALRAAGLDIASSCEAGNCGTCKVRVKCGKIDHRGQGLPDDEKAGNAGEGEAGDMLSCVSRGIGTIQIEL